jgi:hypothetical protein
MLHKGGIFFAAVICRGHFEIKTGLFFGEIMLENPTKSRFAAVPFMDNVQSNMCGRKLRPTSRARKLVHLMKFVMRLAWL